MIIGFTGTREGMTAFQAQWLFSVFCGYGQRPRVRLRHGDCRGSDAQAHAMAWRLGFQIEIFPPTTEAHRAFCRAPGMILHDPQPYLVRNHAIVDGADLLLATPRGMQEELRSGTWATVRTARKMGIPVQMLWPTSSPTHNARSKP
jgi:hypothetical protein